MASQPWATLRVELSPPGDGEPPAAWASALDGLGALVAEDPDVGGVETRDATTLLRATPAELWIYTVPEALSRVAAHVQALAPGLGLVLRLTADARHDEDWRDAWKQFFRPQIFAAGDVRLLLRPSWVARGEGDPPDEIVLDPGHAFGTGLHESTRLCLQRICAIAGTLPPRPRGLDLGCGSGILALALARLSPGATVLAADFDPDATATTVDNAARNGLTSRIDVVTGELSAVPVEAFDFVAANIRTTVLVPLAGALGRWLSPRARVLLSGIFGEEVTFVREAWRAAGYDVVHTETLGEWWLLELESPP